MGIKEYIKEDELTNRSLDMIIETKDMSGAEISRELNISRQAVSQALKRAMSKAYNESKKLDTQWGPFERAVVLSQKFGKNQDSPEELKKFFKLFPPKIRKEIEADAASKFNT